MTTSTARRSNNVLFVRRTDRIASIEERLAAQRETVETLGREVTAARDSLDGVRREQFVTPAKTDEERGNQRRAVEAAKAHLTRANQAYQSARQSLRSFESRAKLDRLAADAWLDRPLNTKRPMRKL